MRKHTTGFTLVELSIVIIIIGLLISGIAAGTSMIKQAKLNGVITELRTIITALNTFKATYNYPPGDLPSAFAMWGTQCGATSADCDGDGDGLIEWNHTGSNDCPAGQEPLHAWQHMKLGGFIIGNYTGQCSDGAGFGLVDAYNSKIGNKAIWILTNGVSGNITSQELFLTKGGEDTFVDDWTPVLTPDQAQNIDSKMDDSLPLTGTIIASEGSGTANTCKANTGNSYVLSEVTPRCVLGFVLH